MKAKVPNIVLTPEPTKDAEKSWERMYSRIFAVALQRLEEELATEDSNNNP